MKKLKTTVLVIFFGLGSLVIVNAEEKTTFDLGLACCSTVVYNWLTTTTHTACNYYEITNNVFETAMNENRALNTSCNEVSKTSFADAEWPVW
jgi:uncharacterized membrane protein